MAKFVMVYEDNSGCVNNRFFECDEIDIPFPTEISIFYAEDPDLTDEQQEFLDKLDIVFESEETILIWELPEEFKKI